MDTKQLDTLRLASIMDLSGALPGSVTLQAAAELRRQHTEIEALRASYDAALDEIASLQERVQELGKAARDVNSRRVQELEAQLAAIGAGGVEPLRKREYPPLVCDYCGALTPDPWHSSGMLHGKMSKHIHSCDSCAVEAGGVEPLRKRECLHKISEPAQPVAQAQDAARYQFLRDGEWRDTELEPFIRLHLNTMWDAKIDAAIAALQGSA